MSLVLKGAILVLMAIFSVTAYTFQPLTTSTYAFALTVYPISVTYGPFTVTVDGYDLINSQHARVYGYARSSLPFQVKVLSAWGTAQSEAGVTLGRGDVQSSFLLGSSDVPVQVYLQSYYTVEQLTVMNIKTVTVYAEAQYCIPTDLWFWAGCVGPFTYPYYHTYTTQELIALAQTYGYGTG